MPERLLRDWRCFCCLTSLTSAGSGCCGCSARPRPSLRFIALPLPPEVLPEPPDLPPEPPPVLLPAPGLARLDPLADGPVPFWPEEPPALVSVLAVGPEPFAAELLTTVVLTVGLFGASARAPTVPAAPAVAATVPSADGGVYG